MEEGGGRCDGGVRKRKCLAIAKKGSTSFNCDRCLAGMPVFVEMLQVYVKEVAVIKMTTK